MAGHLLSSGQNFEVVAVAHGVPPDWIEDIVGTEAWAILQAASLATPGAFRLKFESKSTVDALKAAPAVCIGAKAIILDC